MKTTGRSIFSAGILILLFAISSTVQAHDVPGGGKSIGSSAPANNSNSGGAFQRNNIFMHAQLTLEDMGSGGADNVLGNDIWGWTDSQTGREYALFGLTNATAFVDITDSRNPIYLGHMMTQTGNRTWRDIKVYNDQAYVVADANGEHGMQIFDLTTLRGVTTPQNFSATEHYDGFDRAHNIAINEDSGFAYIVGSEVSSGGIRALDLSLSTTDDNFVAGDFSADGYTHDVQVVNYNGPDQNFAGKEIAFAMNVDTVTIVDVTDKENMEQISRTGYSGANYVHQGWLSEDHRFLFTNDELDERDDQDVAKTITRVWDVEDLANPILLNEHEGELLTIDHNNYTHNGMIFQANYTSGLRVLEMIDENTGELEEFGFFDTYRPDNNVSFNGAWSVFPYFDSGIFIVSDRQNGLFVLSFVPEPGSAGLIAFCLIGFGYGRRRRAK